MLISARLMWYWPVILMTILINRVKPIATAIPRSSYGFLGLWCRYNIFIKLGFLVIDVFLLSWWLHLWLHRLRRLLLVVRTFCAALRGERRRWICSLIDHSDVIPTGVKVSAHRQTRQYRRDSWGFISELLTKVVTYNNAEEIWEVGGSSFAAGPSLEKGSV